MATTFYIHRGDAIPPMDVTLVNVGSTYNPTANVASIFFCIPDPTKPQFFIQQPATILDISTSKVRYTWSSSDIILLPVGTHSAYFVVTYTDNSVRTYPNDGNFIQILVTV